jgi:hypothetical protein
MATGKVLQFDLARGYGFVAAVRFGARLASSTQRRSLRHRGSSVLYAARNAFTVFLLSLMAYSGFETEAIQESREAG